MRFASRPDRLTLVFIVLPLLIAAAMLGLVWEIRSGAGTLWFDAAIVPLIEPYRSASMIRLAFFLTAFGSGTAVVVAGLAFTALFWVRRRELVAPFWLAATAAGLTTWAAKHLVARPRPAFMDIASAASPSFPSSHATAAMVLYGFWAYAMATGVRSGWIRFELAFWGMLFVLAVGSSRVFLGLHYLSDVIGGFLVGAFWLLVAVGAMRARGEAAKEGVMRRPPVRAH